MPSIELLGYQQAEKESLLKTLREALADCAFRDEIVFVDYKTDVCSFNGEQQAYLRICTRNEAKASVLMDELCKYADVEFLKSEAIIFKTD